MPAGQSIVGIWNIAMVELGEDLIATTTDRTTRALLCAARYDDVRQAVIREHPWGCTKKFAQPAAAATAPLFRWSNQYPLPSDFLRMNSIEGYDDSKWQVVGNMLMTNAGSPINLIYHFDLQDTTLFDALMAQCIGYRLALEIMPALVRDDAKIKRINDKLEYRIATAKLVDSQEDSPQEWDDDVLLRSRR